jgi:hypothetical protein
MSRSITSLKVHAADIVDGTAAGRALMTAADAAAQRALLSITDVGDLRNYAIADAIALLGIATPQVVVDESFNCQPGAGNSVFNAVGGTLAQSTLAQGGWFKLTTAAGAGSNATTHNNQRQIVVTNPSTKKWYVLFDFAVSSALNADSNLRLGLYDASLGTANGVYLGVSGATDPTKFGFFQEKAAATVGVLSSVAVDLDVVKRGRMWSDGAGHVYGSFNGESSKTFNCDVTNGMMFHLQMLNGAGGGARAYSFGHALLITE